MKRRFTFFLLMLLFALILTACANVKETEPAPAGLANPASAYCVEQGGTLVIEKNGAGAEYGVCVFEENRQCEEWAMFRGECPVGGVKVTGFYTDAARYCGITGGEYTATGEQDGVEQGTCTKNGETCDVWDYFNGECTLPSAEQ